MDYLFHYTNVETLALILSNRTIRFNALNHVDDLQEQETADIRNLGQFCFVSCWTEETEESIPMWKMYGNLESGVRIRMKTFPFLEKENRPEDLSRVLGQPVQDSSGGNYIKSLITSAEMMKQRISLPGLVQQKDILFKVEYTSDRNKLYPRILFQDDKGTTIALGELGKFKNTGWSFQKEWRYRLQIFPLDMTDVGKIEERGTQMMAEMIQGIATLPFTYYDLQLDNEAYEGMEITLSPKISAGNKVLVNDIVEKYNPRAKIMESADKGLIA